MEYMNEWHFFGCFIGFALILYGTVGYAWLLLYNLWLKHFHRKPLSSVEHIIKLLGWSSLLAFVTTYTLWAIHGLVTFSDVIQVLLGVLSAEEKLCT
jgi:hypothetical protein